MAENNSTAVTAIHDSEFENFAASSLFTEGWSVLHRALDWPSLIEFLESLQQLPDVLLLSTNLKGIDVTRIKLLQDQGVRIFIFQHDVKDQVSFPNSIRKPENALELIGLIRGSIRAPLLRSSTSAQPLIRARVLAIAAAHGGAGCTSLAINIAAELAVAGKKVLLVDAHSSAQSIAILLGAQGLQSAKDFQEISENLSAIEVTQSNIVQSIGLLNRSLSEFDLIVIDSGVLSDLAQNLSGRRWSGEVLVWISVHCDELWIMSQASRLGIERLRRLINELSKNSMKPELSCVQSFTSESKRSKENDQAFLAVTTAIRPKRILRYPLDSRSIALAEKEQSSLYDANERSLLRKSVLDLSGELEL